jgi:hypothetical protein
MLGTAQARSVAELMTQSGLTPHTIFLHNQLPDSCGYNSEAHACMVRELGDQFHTLDEHIAASVSTPGFIRLQNEKLNKGELGTTAYWLTGDDILHLAFLDNPDGASTSPSWLSGPGPLNFWRVHFQRTMADQAEHGVVHIMVVNTENAFSLTEHNSGAHWFVVAWVVEPAAEE